MLNPYLTEERKAFQDMLVRFVATQMTPYIDEWDEANRGGLARIMRRG
ncbi:MAG: acyl-CoA dehydrogenase family protein [Alphaproteobacteria bacterium]|nr:acyl-CoA dehydrogenase family protein [Alphaproteobacteria bacterium]